MLKDRPIMKKKRIKIFTFILISLFASNVIAQELIFDNHFQYGLKVYSPQYPPDNPVQVDGVIGFDSTKTPIWTCAQWSSKSSLIDIVPTIMPNGWYHWENSEKKIYLGPYGEEDYDILFGVNSYSEYGGVYRQIGENWPHLLVEQRLSPPGNAGPGCPPLDELGKLNFHLEAKLENDSTIIQEGYDANIHAAQFLIYFTVQNLNTSSPGYGKDYIWLGVQVYDDRNESPAEYINHDDGTQTLIYSIAFDSVATKSTHTNEWVNINVDLYPYAIKALNEAWQRGYLSASQDLADYKLGGMNMGWELPGMNIADMKIRNLSLIAEVATTVEKDFSKDELGFQLFQNYPNPFNPSTTIKYSIPNTVGTGHVPSVLLKVYNTLGQEIATLVDKQQQPGNYEVVFNATELPSGIYFYRLTIGDQLQESGLVFSETKKLLLLK